MSDLAKLRYSEREAIRRFFEAYPEHLPPDRICKRLQDYGNGEIGDWISDPKTLICAIRRTLGSDAIETVYSYRTNRQGRQVQDQLIGYRLSERIAELMAKQGVG